MRSNKTQQGIECINSGYEPNNNPDPKADEALCSIFHIVDFANIFCTNQSQSIVWKMDASKQCRRWRFNCENSKAYDL